MENTEASLPGIAAFGRTRRPQTPLCAILSSVSSLPMAVPKGSFSADSDPCGANRLGIVCARSGGFAFKLGDRQAIEDLFVDLGQPPAFEG